MLPPTFAKAGADVSALTPSMEEPEVEPELGKAYLDELAAMLLKIDALPLVNSVALVGDPGDKLTNIKVRANLDAEFVPDKNKRHPAICLSKERPTQLDAARALLEKLQSSEKGGYAQELAAAAAAAPADAAAGSSSSHAPSALDRLLAGRVAHQVRKQAADDTERAASEARDTEHAATTARKAAEAMAAKAKAALAAFEPRTAAQREAAAAKRPLLRGVAARARLFARRRGQQAHHLGEGRRQGGQHNARRLLGDGRAAGGALGRHHPRRGRQVGQVRPRAERQVPQPAHRGRLRHQRDRAAPGQLLDGAHRPAGIHSALERAARSGGDRPEAEKVQDGQGD